MKTDPYAIGLYDLESEIPTNFGTDEDDTYAFLDNITDILIETN